MDFSLKILLNFKYFARRAASEAAFGPFSGGQGPIRGKKWKFQIFSSIVCPTMAVPKKKTTRARRDLRRYSSAYRLHAVQSVQCKNCNAPILPHRICGECGHYDGKQVVAAKSAEA